MERIIDIFADRIKALRVERGLSSTQLEKQLHLGNGTVGKWENLKSLPSVECLVLIAKFFGVSTDYLLGLED